MYRARSEKTPVWRQDGMTMACHIILVADAGNYEQILPQIDESLNIVRIRLRSPSIRFPG